jgi:hypothetical protein
MTMNNNDNNSNTSGFYRGPTKVIIDENGRKIRKPDLSSSFLSPNNSATFKCFYCNDRFNGSMELVNQIDEEHSEKLII